MSEQPGFLRPAPESPLPSIVKTLNTQPALVALLLASICVDAINLQAQTPTPVTVPTWRYDLTHAGQNTKETALTPANVNVNSFGKLFSLSVDGEVFAQPLYVPGLKMSDGRVHNVLFIATEYDSVYAFDADSNTGANANPIWHASFLTAAHGAGAGATPVSWQDTSPDGNPNDGSPDVAPWIGITGTPAINPATNTMYVVANTKESGAFFSRLHAINILTGAEQSSNSPVDITATVAGTGSGSTGGKVSFSALWENQRTALDYYNGYVYFGYAAHGDILPWHGWLFAYNATTLKQSAVLCLSPNDHGAGLWSAGAGFPIDDDATGGRMFIVTGNGALSTYPPFEAGQDLSMSVLNLSLANGGLAPTDGFTSFNYETLNTGDYDQGSGGVLMIPDQQGTHPHILVQVGKEGRVLVLDRDKLGGYNKGGTSNPNALQDLGVVTPGGMWATPAYWNGNVYIWGVNDVAKLFKLNSGVMDTEASSKSSITSQFPSPSFSISSNGTQDGIAWATRSDQFNTDGPAVLYAWDANDLTKPIYESDTKPTRDAAGPANKFSIPVVTDGKVYVAANGEVNVYGLFNGEPTAAAPVISPDGGTFSASQSVTLTSTTPSASIFYTLDGSTPTTASRLYSEPIAIDTDTTLKAIASAAGYVQSAVSSATFTFTGQTPLPTIKPAGGTYLAAQKVTISDSDSAAKIYYTTNGAYPTTSSKLYSGPIAVSVSETVKAIAVAAGLRASNRAEATYVIQQGGSSINFGGGFASTTGLTLNGSVIATGRQLQLTHGDIWEGSSVWWSTPIPVQAFTSNFEFQVSPQHSGNGFTFTLQNMGVHALGGDSAGLGYQDIQKSVGIKFNFYDYMNGGSDSTGVYTDGKPPLTPSVDIAPSGIQLVSGNIIAAQLTYDGTTLTLSLRDEITNDTFATSWIINIPQIVGGNTAYVGFTAGTGGGLSATQRLLTWTYATHAVPPVFAPAPGTYRKAQSVVLSSTTANAVLHYTTNGTEPTAASPRYSAPIAVAATKTIKAVAISSSEGSSVVRTAEYFIKPTTSGPAFTLTASQPATIGQAKSTTSTVTVTPSGGFRGPVTFSCAVAARVSGTVETPSCSAITYVSITGTAAESSKFTIASHAATTPGTYTITLTGRSGSITDSTSVAIRVTGTAATPAFTLSGGSIVLPSPGASSTSTISVTPVDGFTGDVMLDCKVSGTSGAIDPPTCAASRPDPILGAASVTSTLTVRTRAATTLGDYKATLTGTSGGLAARRVLPFIVYPAPGTEFTMTSTDVGILQAGESATSTITITPKGGYTGPVAVKCAITDNPADAINMPTCSASQPSVISGTGSVTSTLTVHTTGPAPVALHTTPRRILAMGSEAALAALLFVFLPHRRRNWNALLTLPVLFILAIATIGCGGVANAASGSSQSRTTPGSYTATVTGTDGLVTASTAVIFLVN